jgi:hypothetical protein
MIGKSGEGAVIPLIPALILAGTLLVSYGGCGGGTSVKPSETLPPEKAARAPVESLPADEQRAEKPPAAGERPERFPVPAHAPEPGPPEAPAGTPAAAPAETGSAPSAKATPSAPPAVGNARAPERAEKEKDAATTAHDAAPGILRPAPAPAAAAKPYAAARAGEEQPEWAKRNEELVYRVQFLGVTMGYARFTFKGKVLMDGKEAYHLSVRAWTSDFLSIIYPVNDIIEYYLDPRTLAPLRQEFTKLSDRENYITTYNQEKGTIVQRNRSTGEVRRRIDAAPRIYDPVTLTYYFRSWHLGAENHALQVYAGRKVWQISSKSLGTEKLLTTRGEVETIVIKPIIRYQGKIDEKGDLRVWMTNDARHVPVRLYAKFRKIREWTLYGELMPQREGG